MENKQERNQLEKVAFISGLIILISLLGYLTMQIFKKADLPPDLLVTLIKDQKSVGLKYKVEVENQGEETAEATIINFHLYRNGVVQAKAELSIDYVPQHSKEIGFIVFPGENTPADSIVINSMSYIRP